MCNLCGWGIRSRKNASIKIPRFRKYELSNCCHNFDDELTNNVFCTCTVKVAKNVPNVAKLPQFQPLNMKRILDWKWKYFCAWLKIIRKSWLTKHPTIVGLWWNHLRSCHSDFRFLDSMEIMIIKQSKAAVCNVRWHIKTANRTGDITQYHMLRNTSVLSQCHCGNYHLLIFVVLSLLLLLGLYV